MPLTSTQQCEDSYFQPDKQQAEKNRSEAQQAVDSGDSALAQEFLAKALLADPDQMAVYRQLGRLYASTGDSEIAERCFKGFLPDEFAFHHFGEVDTAHQFNESFENTSDTTTLYGQSITRHCCHVSQKRSIAKPISITPAEHPAFRPTELTSSVALVDKIPHGSVYFDGYNRLVLDQSNRAIDLHTRGNLHLLHNICNSHTPRALPGRCFLIGNRGSNNFYHWMVDILPFFELFQQCQFKFGKTDRFIVHSAASSFHKSCLKQLGIRGEQIVEARKDTPYFQATELVIPFFSNAMAMTMGAWIPRYLKSVFLTKEVESPVNAEKLYLSRAPSAQNGRSIPNEQELIEFLSQRGFETILPEKFSVPEQASIFAQADVVVASHGAALTNIVFCKPGTSVIELYGDYMASCYWAISAHCGLHYLNHYCKPTCGSEDQGRQSHEFIENLRQKGFSVNLDEIDRLLKLEEATHSRINY